MLLKATARTEKGGSRAFLFWHDLREVTCRKDHAQINASHAPQAPPAMRNTALTILCRLGFKPPEGLEHFAEHRQGAIDAPSKKRTK